MNHYHPHEIDTYNQMNPIVLTSPFLIYLIYSILSGIHAVSIFQASNDYDKELSDVKEYENNKYYLGNILKVFFQKSTFLDAYGFHFLNGNWRTMSLIILTIIILFFLVFITLMSIIFFGQSPTDGNPFFLYAISVAKFVVGLMIFRGCISYSINFIEWIRYKWHVRKIARTDELWSHWFTDIDDHEKGLLTFVDQENSNRDKNIIALTTQITDLIRYIASDHSGTRKLIYFCIFTASVVNSFTLIETSFPEIRLDDGEAEIDGEKDNVRAGHVLPKILLRLLIISGLSYFAMCIFLTLIWALGMAVLKVGLMVYDAIESNPKGKSSLFFKQFKQLILLVVTKNYIYDESTDSNDLSWMTRFKKDLVGTIFIKGIFMFLYGFLITSIFVIWFESKPGRYSKPPQIREDEIDEGFVVTRSDVSDRIRRYTLLCKSFIIFMGFFVGCIIVYQSNISGGANTGSDNISIVNLNFGAMGLAVLCIFMILLFYI